MIQWLLHVFLLGIPLLKRDTNIMSSLHKVHLLVLMLPLLKPPLIIKSHLLKGRI